MVAIHPALLLAYQPSIGKQNLSDNLSSHLSGHLTSTPNPKVSSSSHQALPSLLQRTLRLLLLRSPLSQAAKEVLREGGVNKLHKPRDLVALGVEVQQDHVLVAIRPDDRVRLAAAPDGDGVGGVVLDDGLDRWREVLEERHDAAEVRAEFGVGLLGAVEGAWVGVSGLGWEGDEGGFKAYTRGRLGRW